MREWRLAAGVLMLMLVLLLPGCGGQPDTPAPASPAPPTPTAPATLSQVIVHLQRDYEALNTAHESLSDIWETLADQETVRCGPAIDLPQPDSISAEGDPSYDALAGWLRQAAIELDRAAALWDAECANPRANPAPATIQQGLLAVRAAGDALRAARPLLAPIQ